MIVTPETVVRWHREGFREYWRWRSSHTVGRKRISQELRELIFRMVLENPTWGAPRIRLVFRDLIFQPKLAKQRFCTCLLTHHRWHSS